MFTLDIELCLGHFSPVTALEVVISLSISLFTILVSVCVCVCDFTGSCFVVVVGGGPWKSGCFHLLV